MTRISFAWKVAAAALLAMAPAAAQAQASPSAYTVGHRYDAAGRETGTILPDPDGDTNPLKYAATRNSYDGAGRLIKVEQGELAVWKSEAVAPSAWGTDFTVLKTVDTLYDALDRKVKVSVTGTDAIVATLTQYSYDLGGQLDCTAVRMIQATFASLPPGACAQATAQTNDEPDRISKNIYDAAGQLIQLREGWAPTSWWPRRPTAIR